MCQISLEMKNLHVLCCTELLSVYYLFMLHPVCYTLYPICGPSTSFNIFNNLNQNGVHVRHGDRLVSDSLLSRWSRYLRQLR